MQGLEFFDVWVRMAAYPYVQLIEKALEQIMMYAVIESGGKQYRVSLGQTVKVEKIEAEPGSVVQLNHVLLLSKDGEIQVGAPYLEGVQLMAEVVEQGRGEKIRIFKMKRRKNSRKRMGHRQDFTGLKIVSLGA